jgi:CRP/FNR family transcriptional regulator/CRP/FNR family cyclic AMP-dependent transcriptional regulator
MTKGVPRLIDLLKNVSLFTMLNESQLELISRCLTRKFADAGTLLFREKEIGTEFYILVSGSVKIYTTGAGGEEKILAVMQAGDSFGELALIDGKPRSASARTVEKSVLLCLSKQDFHTVLSSHFDITLGIMQELCQRLRDTNEHVRDLTFLDARTRVLKQLIQMANRSGIRKGSEITLRVVLNFDELAQYAGVQRSDIMQVIRELEARGILAVAPDSFTLNLANLRN